MPSIGSSGAHVKTSHRTFRMVNGMAERMFFVKSLVIGQSVNLTGTVVSVASNNPRTYGDTGNNEGSAAGNTLAPVVGILDPMSAATVTSTGAAPTRPAGRRTTAAAMAPVTDGVTPPRRCRMGRTHPGRTGCWPNTCHEPTSSASWRSFTGASRAAATPISARSSGGSRI
jgi:hypothetical protein